MRITTDDWAAAGYPLDLAPGIGAFVYDAKADVWVHDIGPQQNAIIDHLSPGAREVEPAVSMWCYAYRRERLN